MSSTNLPTRRSLLSKMKRVGKQVGLGAQGKVVHPKVASTVVKYSINVCDNHVWKDRGQETTISITSSTTFEGLKATLSKQFNYKRPIVIKTPLFGDGRPMSPGSPGSPTGRHNFISGGSAFANMLMDQDEANEIRSTADLKSSLKKWSEASISRRRKRVEVIRDEILITLSSTLPKERVVGLNRIWELVQREVNMHACDDHTLSCVRLALSDQNWDVGGAAARVVWKMAEHPQVNKKLAASDAPQLLLNNLMKRTKNKDGAEDDAHDFYYHHNIGALLSLASSTFIRGLLTDHSTVLLELCCRSSHMETLKTASEGLCMVLATSRSARKKIAGTKRIHRLANLMSSGNTYVVLSAAASISTFARSKVDRKLVEGRDVLDLLQASLQTARWCVEELHATKELFLEASSKKKLGASPDGLASKILEYSSIALWGFASVLLRDDKVEDLLEEGLGLLKDLVELAGYNDDARVHSTVTTACSGALSVLSFKLAPNLAKIPMIISRVIDILFLSKDSGTAEEMSFTFAYLCAAQPIDLMSTMNGHEGGYDKVFDLMKRWLQRAEIDKKAISILKNLSCALMWCMDMEDKVKMEHLQSVIQLLTIRNKGVLMNVSSTIWCLARNEWNRDTMGKLFVMNGLHQVLNGNSDLELKARVMGAIWLMSCNEKNAVRFAMLGGLQALCSFLKFENAKCYMPLKTLSVCVLYELQKTEDIFSLMKQVDIESSIMGTLQSKHLTPYMHVQCAGLVFFMSKDAESRERYQKIGGQFYLEDLFARMVLKDNVEVQVLGVFGITTLAMEVESKKYFGKTGCIKGMSALLDSTKITQNDQIKVLHGFLNLSQDIANQKEICRHILLKLTNFARLGEKGGLKSEFSASILSNLSNNGDCRAEMYKLHLAQCSSAVSKTMKEEERKLLEDNGGEPLSDAKKEIAEAESVKTVRLALGRVRARINRKVTGLWEDEPVEIDVAERVQEYNRKNDRGGFVAKRRASMSMGGELKDNMGQESLVSSATGRGATQRKDSTFDTPLPTTPKMSETKHAFSSTGRPRTAPALTGGTSTRISMAVSLKARNNVLSPLRSSHRVGPVGRLGSEQTEEGENRWRPPIVSYTKSLNTFESSKSAGGPGRKGEEEDDAAASGEEKKEEPARAPRGTNQNISGARYSLILQPPVPYNRITFNTNKYMKGESKVKIAPTPVKLVMWKKVEDSVIGHGLFDHFISDDGETLFFYHTSSIVCEALEPGPYPTPIVPLLLVHTLQERLPKPRTPKGPSEEDKEIAPAYIPHLPTCPPIDRHYIPLCSLATKAALRTMKPSLEQVGRANMFGAIPIEPMRLIAEMEPEILSETEEEEEAVAEAVVEKEPWDITKSIFGDRRQLSDSRAFYNTPKVIKRALEADFNRMLGEPRIAKLISKEDSGVKSGESVETELKEIKEALEPLYETIIDAFEYYCLLSNNQTRNCFVMGELSFTRFCNDCKMVDSKLSSEGCQQAFIAVNVETNKNSQESKLNDDKCLMRMEFIEIIIRFAITKYKEEAGSDISEAVGLLVRRNLAPHIPPMGKVDSDDFRRDRLYNEETENVFTNHKRVLKMVYKKYKDMLKVAGTPLFSIPEWMLLLKESGLVGDKDDGDFTAREAMLCFFKSRMCVVDEVKSRHKYISLTYTDFLEALGRVSDVVSIPTSEDMEMLGADNMCDYKEKLRVLSASKQEGGGIGTEEKSRLLERRPSSDFLTPSERPLSEKVDKLIQLMIGGLGLRSKGLLTFENQQVKLVSKYLSQDQWLVQ
ncbi:hypothetical protein TrRE_jg10777 [Triparma retinervis]|uniref:Uncharacterized protein n=1 Tax=Triparma retinervis TaxID=2557542 RepID=A0A9W6Z341_9STRA|nr:hypothetical protein TrRE_jg10777 [Triparma retinervis]